MEEITYCCENMQYYISSQKEDLVKYDSSVRTYNFILHKNSKKLQIRQELYFCPWCGTELPKALGDEKERLLEEKYNLTIKDFWDEKGNWDESKIPAKFRTDEWWKKRGL